MKLNLGCGQNKYPGFVNIDKYARFDPDLQHDLEQFPWPFEDASVTEVLAIHVLEHLGERSDTFLKIIQELYRVMTVGAFLRVHVPHHRSESFAGDPTHVRPITIGLFTLLSRSNCRKWGEERAANTPLAEYLDVDFEIDGTEVILSEHWQKKRIAEEMTNDDINLALQSFNNVAEEVRFIIRKAS